MKELIALIDEAIPYAIAAVIIYGVISFFVMGCGVIDAQEIKYDRWEGKVPCLEQPTNFELLFPAYKLGCWIGAKQGEKYYWSKP